ncbi:MAG TPA: hypothetical protein VGO73_12080 [Pyrinomonadaceae bacterium]|nr:hypothetical protein [Pyrinomonadaceae bacterium]
MKRRSVCEFAGRAGSPHRPRCLAAAIMLSGLSFIPLAANAQQTPPRQIVFPVAIQWNKQKAAVRYRLQIAADQKFQDVFFDRLVVGNRYVVSDLAFPGFFYWRVAPADSQLGSFSRPVRFFVSGGVVTTPPRVYASPAAGRSRR